jgi:hypothetical protein
MNQFDAPNLLITYQILVGWYAQFDLTSRTGNGHKIPLLDQREKILDAIKDANQTCYSLGLSDAAYTAGVSYNHVTARPEMDFSSMGNELRHIVEAIIIECRKHKFLRVKPQGRSAYYGGGVHAVPVASQLVIAESESAVLPNPLA